MKEPPMPKNIGIYSQLKATSDRTDSAKESKKGHQSSKHLKNMINFNDITRKSKGSGHLGRSKISAFCLI